MLVRHVVRCLALSLVVLAGACGGEDATAPHRVGPAVAYAIVSGDGQTGTVGQDLAQPIRVLATDALNQPVPNVVVNFVVTAGGGSVFAGSALTDASGIAAEVWTLGTVAGATQTLEVRAVDPTGTKHTYGTFTANAAAGTPTTIIAVAGDGQTAAASTPVPVAPSVKLSDQYGNPVPNAAVTFAVVTGGGSVTGGSATSDAAGIATVGSWVMGALAGTNTLTATAAALPGSPITFSATATPGVPPQLDLLTAPSASAQNGALLAAQPVIRLLDAQNAPILQAGVPITVTLNGAGATLSGTTTVSTTGSGQAAFTNLAITGTVGSGYTLSFSSPGISTITSGPIALTPGAPAALVLSVGEGQSAVVGTAVAIAPAVLVVDQSGNVVAGVTVNFVVNSGGGSVTGATAVSASNGLATLGSWTLGSTPGANTLVASAPSIQSSTVTFHATATQAVPTKLSLSTSPASTAQNGVALSTAPVVQLQDAQGNAVTQSGVTITASLSGAGAALGGTLNASTDANGRATFSGLVITGTVGNYALRFDASGLTGVTSGSIALSAGLPAALTLSAGNGQSATTGTAVAVAPAVRVADQSGNSVAGVSVTFAVTAGGGSVTGGTAVTGSNGIATVGSWVLGAVAGGNSLTATTAAVPAASVVFSATGTAPSSGSWTAGLAALPIARRYAAYGVINNQLYVAGGRNNTGLAATLQSYNPTTNTWSTRQFAPTFRNGATAGVLNGLLYVVGGNNSSGTLASMESYNPATNTWTARASLPEPKEFAASGVVNGILYVAGGGNQSGMSKTVYAYDPATNTWTQKASMPLARNDLAGTAINGLFYTVGGTTPTTGSDGALQAYDPVTDTWTALATMPSGRYHLNAAANGGKLYAVGGYLGVPSVNRVEIYDIATNSWSQGADMPTPRAAISLGFINGVLYVSGGVLGNSNTGDGTYNPVNSAATEKFTP